MAAYKTIAEKKRMNNGFGYARIHLGGKKVLEHVLVAERALGRPLPERAEVHHVNGVRSDNRPENLVICDSREYHHVLHVRARAVAAGCPADWLKCQYCETFSDPSTMYVRGNCVRHRTCNSNTKKGRSDGSVSK